MLNISSRVRWALLLMALWGAVAGAWAQPALKQAASAAARSPAKGLPARAASAPSRAASMPQKSAAAATPEGYAVAPVPGWVKPVAEETADALPAPAAPFLLMDRQVRLGTGAQSQFEHFIRRINDASGLQAAAQIEIVFDPTYQKLVMHQVDVVREGQRLPRLDARLPRLLRRETQLERQIIDGRMTASIVLDDVRVGDRIEWSYTLEGANPVFAGRYVANAFVLANAAPVAQWQLRLLAPADRRIAHRVGGPEIKVEETVADGWRETRVSRQGIPQWRPDPTWPPDVYLRDQVEFSEFTDWSEVAAWAADLFATTGSSSSESLKRLAGEIQARHPGTEDRLRAALDFVQREVRYFGTEVGPYTHRPAPVDAVLRQRFGDCKDKSALLVGLLGLMGIEGTPVLVSQSYRGATAQRLPSPLAFDHAIAQVRVGDQTLWLDATRNLQTGQAAARQATGFGVGLPAASAARELARLPDASGVLRQDVSDEFHFKSTAVPGELVSTALYGGETAELVRGARASMSPDDFQRWLSGELRRIHPGLTPTQPPTVEDDPQLNQVRVVSRYAVADHWKFPEQRQLSAQIALIGPMQALRTADLTARTQPMRLGPPGLYRYRVAYQFDEPLFNANQPAPHEDGNRWFDLKVQHRYEPRRFVLSAELNLKADRLEASEAGAYRQLLERNWPKLFGTFAVPPLSLAELESLRQEVEALRQRIQRGDMKLVTAMQVEAAVRVAAATRVIDAGRLPPKLLAEMLVARGARLEHLGRRADAERDLARARELDPQSAAALAASGMNAVLQGRDRDAIAFVDRVTQISGPNSVTRHVKVWAQYYGGDVAAARQELLGLLRDRSEVERGYGSLWLYLATRRLGGDTGDVLRQYAPTGPAPAWPHPVWRYFEGRLDFDAALAATREGGKPNLGRECELYFFAGEKALLDGDESRARDLFRRAVATGVVEYTEYSLAQRSLARLEKR